MLPTENANLKMIKQLKDIEDRWQKILSEAPLPKFRPDDTVLVKFTVNLPINKKKYGCRGIHKIISGYFSKKTETWVYVIDKSINREGFTDYLEALEEDLEKI